MTEGPSAEQFLIAPGIQQMYSIQLSIELYRRNQSGIRAITACSTLLRIEYFAKTQKHTCDRCAMQFPKHTFSSQHRTSCASEKAYGE
jgi:hypothetical protein